ncbi:unnamed protein product [Cuscuta campestris]|uniref:Integrase catalytic domain-containing protein n=1 Tax=Cuscuta campestris TaxID=132261 RepID=A0A484M0P0_9ASTE|nr:unnamed protein product [Cuscuta campestris]
MWHQSRGIFKISDSRSKTCSKESVPEVTQITPDGNVRSVHSKDEGWDVPQAQKKLKGKAVQPEGSRRLAFQRLGHDGRNQNRSARERLGVETTPVNAFDRLGRGARRPGRTRRTEPPPHDEPQNSRAPHQEEEAESHPRHTVRSHVEQLRDRVGRVEARLEKLQRRVDRDEKKKILLNESPFTDRVHETPFPKKAKLEVPKFTGKEDPEIHTLRGRAAEWFHNLPAGEIDSFDELAEVFQEKFKENCTKRKKFTYLSTAGQREHEDLTKFLTRWKDEVDKVEEMDDKTAMSLLVSELRSGELYKEFCRRPPQSYQEAYNTAWDYADIEAQVSSKREAEQGHSRGRISLKKEIELPGRVKTEVMEGVIKQMIEAGEFDPEYLAQAKQKKNQWVRPEGQLAEQSKKKKAAIRPGINKVRGIISMVHLCMKFYTSGGIRQVRGDQKKARSCYLEAVKKMTKAFERVTLVSQEEDRSKLEPGDETEQIVLWEAFPERMVKIGWDLPGGLREEVISVLQEFADIFAWSVADMPGIDRSIICHRLAVIEGSRPVKQKKRHLANVRRDFVKNEVKDLLSFKIEYKPRTAIKGQALADFLVELTGLEAEVGPSHTVESWWDMAVDGASGPKGCGAGIVFTTPEGFKIYHALVFNFKLTNNEADYEELAGGLRLAWALGIKRMKIRSDSSLVVGQVNGEMEVKEDRLARYSDLVRALLRELEEFRLTRIPRSENVDADMLSKLTQACPEQVSKLAKIEILDQPSADRFEVAAIQQGQSSATGVIEADDNWRYDLMEYLMTGQKPDDEERARKVVLRAPWFQVLDGHLYKRAIRGPLLRCLTNPEAERVIAEVHEGICAAHHMSRTLAQRIILLGYYLPTIVRDCERYVQKCRTCQVFYKHPGTPATYYQPTSNVIPFARFGIDIIGAFPVAQGGKKFVMVAIDYFTKWIEAEAMATITVRQCEKFVWKNIVTRFGAPKMIVTDNGPQFRNPRFTAYLASFRIKHSKASVAYPQENGQVENANRIIVDGLKKRLGEEGRKWETVYQPGQNEADHLAELNLVEERRTMAAVKRLATSSQLRDIMTTGWAHVTSKCMMRSYAEGMPVSLMRGAS